MSAPLQAFSWGDATETASHYMASGRARINQWYLNLRERFGTNITKKYPAWQVMLKETQDFVSYLSSNPSMHDAEKRYKNVKHKVDTISQIPFAIEKQKGLQFLQDLFEGYKAGQEKIQKPRKLETNLELSKNSIHIKLSDKRVVPFNLLMRTVVAFEGVSQYAKFIMNEHYQLHLIFTRARETVESDQEMAKEDKHNALSFMATYVYIVDHLSEKSKKSLENLYRVHAILDSHDEILLHNARVLLKILKEKEFFGEKEIEAILNASALSLIERIMLKIYLSPAVKLEKTR